MKSHTTNRSWLQVNGRREPLVEVLHTREFTRAFLGSLSREIQKMTIVSPFVTPIPGFRSPLEFYINLATRMPNASFEIVTSPPNDSKHNVFAWYEAKLIAQLGVSVMIRPSKLHSKVYYVQYPEGDSSTFVGSSNFTKGGFQTNFETVAHWRRSQPDLEIERELARLAGPGSYDLLQWSVRTAGKVELEEWGHAN